MIYWSFSFSYSMYYVDKVCKVIGFTVYIVIVVDRYENHNDTIQPDDYVL